MVQYDSIKRDWDINIENNDDGYIMGITMGYKPSQGIQTMFQTYIGPQDMKPNMGSVNHDWTVTMGMMKTPS